MTPIIIPLANLIILILPLINLPHHPHFSTPPLPLPLLPNPNPLAPSNHPPLSLFNHLRTPLSCHQRVYRCFLLIISFILTLLMLFGFLVLFIVIVFSSVEFVRLMFVMVIFPFAFVMII
jgi:hypothetical protein